MGKKPFNTLDSCVIAKIHDKDGNLVHEQIQECRSLLRNFNRFICAILRDNTSVIVVDIFGSSTTVDSDYHNLRSEGSTAPYGTDSYGLVVGSGGTSVAIDDYCLNTQIYHGVSFGRLLYSESSSYDIGVTWGSSESYAYIIRRFTNNSGSTVTVRECGIYNSQHGSRYICHLRDIFSPELLVGDSQTLTLEIRLKVNL